MICNLSDAMVVIVELEAQLKERTQERDEANKLVGILWDACENIQEQDAENDTLLCLRLKRYATNAMNNCADVAQAKAEGTR